MRVVVTYFTVLQAGENNQLERTPFRATRMKSSGRPVSSESSDLMGDLLLDGVNILVRQRITISSNVVAAAIDVERLKDSVHHRFTHRLTRARRQALNRFPVDHLLPYCLFVLSSSSEI